MWVVQVQKGLVDLTKHYIDEINAPVSLDRVDCFIWTVSCVQYCQVFIWYINSEFKIDLINLIFHPWQISKYNLTDRLMRYTALSPRSMQMELQEACSLYTESLRTWRVCILYGLGCGAVR